MKKLFLPLFLVSCALCLSAAKQPNILFIFSDDHTTQATGSYDTWLKDFVIEHEVTPNLDRLADEGAVFVNSFCGNSICGPARASILTGLHSHANGFLGNHKDLKPPTGFDGSQWTFPKTFQKEGYQTAIYGKWHLGSAPTGFDSWSILRGQGMYYNPDMRTTESTAQEDLTRIEGHSSEVIANLALKWLKEGRDSKKPFMLMCQFKAPHRNWMPAPEYVDFLDDVIVPEPETLFDNYATRSPAAANQAMSIRTHMTDVGDLKLTDPLASLKTGNKQKGLSQYVRMTLAQRENWDKGYAAENKAFHKAKLSGDDLVRWKYQRYVKDYLRSVKGVDTQIGRLLDYLDKNGLSDNTIVIYSSDQGFYLGEHNWFDKRWMYEESLRMPLIVRWPGTINPGSRPDAMVQNIDFAPTFLEMAGLESPDDRHGKSLVPIMKGKTPKNWRKSIYYQYFEFPGPHSVARHRGVRTERFKLMHLYEDGDWEFYDLEKDPTEVNNSYDNPEYASQIQKLKKEMAKLSKQYGVKDTDR